MSSDAADPRLEQIVEVLVAFAAGDFSARAPVSDALDPIDAIATGLNMMAEELDGELATRREVQDAYRSLKEAQAKLLHTAKLVAIGQLASGVAHEINNPAAWVSLAASLAKQRVAQIRSELGREPTERTEQALRVALEELDAVLTRVSEGIDRIRTVAVDLRMFARADTDATELVLLDDVVRTTIELLKPSVEDRASLSVRLGDVPAVRGNRGRLGQIVTNLVVNATEALEREKAAHKGSILVSTKREDDRVILTVEDDGPGIPHELVDRVFDPFFTTNPSGTGLGLSLVAEIVKRHEGEVRLQRTDRKGARFEVLLPIAEAVLTPRPPPPASPRAPS